MTEQANGTVAFIKQNDYGFYSIKVGDKWYGTGSKNDPGVTKGDNVSFDFYLKNDKWATVKGKIEKTGKAAPKASSGASSDTRGTSSGGSTNDGYWAAKTKYEQEILAPRLTRSKALDQANAFVANAIAAGTLASLLKKDGLDSLAALTIDKANEFVVYANGTPAAAPAASESEHVEEESEELEE